MLQLQGRRLDMADPVLHLLVLACFMGSYSDEGFRLLLHIY